jgi:hypothetical protein
MATATTTSTSYFALISQDEKATKAEALKLKAQESGLALNQEIFNLTVDISKKNTEIAALQRAIPYSVGAEYRATNELAELNKRLTFANTVKTERFADSQI